jgi:hypothetical protein
LHSPFATILEASAVAQTHVVRPDGKMLISVCAHFNIRACDHANGKEIWQKTVRIANDSRGNPLLALFPDGKRQACATSNTLRVIDPFGPASANAYS